MERIFTFGGIYVRKIGRVLESEKLINQIKRYEIYLYPVLGNSTYMYKFLYETAEIYVFWYSASWGSLGCELFIRAMIFLWYVYLNLKDDIDDNKSTYMYKIIWVRVIV